MNTDGHGYMQVKLKNLCLSVFICRFKFYVCFMFGLFKKKNPYEAEAAAAYAQIAAHIREPAFFKKHKVPDTFDGRYDLLLVHAFIVMQALRQIGDSREGMFNQALFDATFSNMDQTLREMGIGDMGISKHMRKMMKAFNGRMHAYATSLERGDLLEVLHRNLYSGDEAVDLKTVERFATYVTKQLERLTDQGFDKVIVSKKLFLKP